MTTKGRDHSGEPDTMPAEENEGSRRPYEPPAWEEEVVFERAAVVCAKAIPAACGAGPIQS